jgi:hypothetical protein
LGTLEFVLASGQVPLDKLPLRGKNVSCRTPEECARHLPVAARQLGLQELAVTAARPVLGRSAVHVRLRADQEHVVDSGFRDEDTDYADAQQRILVRYRAVPVGK